MHLIIDSSILSNVPWQCMVTAVSEDVDEHAPSWMQTNYEVWYHDPDTVVSIMLDNPDFEGQFNLRPYINISADGKRQWNNVMSGNIAWRRCVSHWHLQDTYVLIMPFQNEIISSNPRALGAMYCPIILRSDKTTVSVATGHIEYHPLYLSIGNPHNTVQHAHCNAVVPIAFLAIPKSVWMFLSFINLYILGWDLNQYYNPGEHRFNDNPKFRAFKRKLYHTSVAAVLSSLHPGMKEPVIRRCPDGHFRCVIYDFISFIADYPEQVMLMGIAQGWCPKWAIHSLAIPPHDLLVLSDVHHNRTILMYIWSLESQNIQKDYLN